MALQYWRGKRTKFIAFTEAYHGDTVGAMSVGGIRLFHEAFRPLTFNVLRAGTTGELKALLSNEIAGVCIEPLIQGAAGMRVWPRGMLREVRHLCRDTLLIADEVMTGFGRTGTMFACEKEDVVPDLMALAKGLTGGYLPLAATMASAKVFDAFMDGTFFHGHSFTGNQLGCAAALANLEIFEEEHTLENLKPKIDILKSYLGKFPVSRQCGFIGAVEVEQGGAKVCRELRARGVLTRHIGNVIVIMPPYCIKEEQLAHIFEALGAVIA